MVIPFNRTFLTGGEEAYLQDALHVSGVASDGKYTQGCASFLEKTFGLPKVLMTPSCTASLEIAALLCDLRSGDEVILPSFTFVSTANAFARLGATLVYVEIRPDTLNIDETQIEAAITPMTKAIVPIHYGGICAEMDTILDLSKRYGLRVIEDAAQAVCSAHRDRPAGGMGDLGCFSFHDTKNFGCGEGGAISVNDAQLADRAEILRDKGTNRRRYFRGQVDKYTWVDVGSSYVPSELACAFLLAQLEGAAEILDRRRRLFENYQAGLRDLELAKRVRLPIVPASEKTNFHIFYVLLPNRDMRDRLIAWLKSKEIHAVFHYVPLHSSPMGRQLTPCQPPLPITDLVSDTLVRLPMFPDLTPSDQSRILDEIRSFFASEPPVELDPRIAATIS